MVVVPPPPPPLPPSGGDPHDHDHHGMTDNNLKDESENETKQANSWSWGFVRNGKGTWKWGCCDNGRNDHLAVGVVLYYDTIERNLIVACKYSKVSYRDSRLPSSRRARLFDH